MRKENQKAFGKWFPQDTSDADQEQAAAMSAMGPEVTPEGAVPEHEAWIRPHSQAWQ